MDDLLERAHERAFLTGALLGVVVLVDVAQAVDAALMRGTCGPHEEAARCGFGPPELEGWLLLAGLVAFSACAIAFWSWVSASFVAARELGAPLRRGAANAATVGYLVPIASLWLPLRGMRDLDRAIDPAHAPVPPPRANPGEHTLGYRDAAVAPPSSPRDASSAPLGLWWALWCARWALGMLAVPGPWLVTTWLIAAVDCAAAAAAITVVWRIDGRLGDFARRCLAARSP